MTKSFQSTVLKFRDLLNMVESSNQKALSLKAAGFPLYSGVISE
jgi:hypothetical protein